MAQTLNFTQVGNKFVSDTLNGGATGSVVINIDFSDTSSHFLLERTIDENVGWATVLSTQVSNCIWEDTITGIVDGVSIRVTLDINPTSAKYITA